MHITEQPFQGTRVRLASSRAFETVLESLLEDIGHTPVNMEEITATYETWDAFREHLEGLAGPSGFMLFGLIDHGAWTRKAGVSRRAVRVILGNPLIAITMLRHDSEAGLFAPVELLLLEESENTSRLLYVKPSSLMVVNANPPLQEAAAGLDRKLAALAVKIAGE
jgi:uncharacterized protein (DUF302 family)